MRILYIYFLLGRMAGVEAKIEKQAAALDAINDTTIDFAALNRVKSEQNGRIRYVRLRQTFRPIEYFNFLFRRYYLIESHLNLDDYDWIILRHPYADPSGPGFMRRHRVITEHHSNEIAELRSHLGTPISLPLKVFRAIRYLLEKKYGAVTLCQCNGLIAVTPEILKFEESRTNRPIPGQAIPNGVDVVNTSLTGYAPFDGRTLHLAFLGSNNDPWHGVDRLLKSLYAYPGKIQIHLHLIGNFSESELSKTLSLPKNLHFQGVLTGADLDAILKNMNAAISTLGLYCKDLQEASSLKTREYTARGLPFIIAYSDPDLQMVDPKRQFFLEFENTDRLIDFQQVIDFVRNFNESYNPTELSNCMRQYALTHMDWTVKMRQYLDFVNQLDTVDLSA